MRKNNVITPYSVDCPSKVVGWNNVIMRWTVRVKSLSEITLLRPIRWTVRAKSLGEITLLCPTRWTVRVKSLSEITLLCPTRWTVRVKSLSEITLLCPTRWTVRVKSLSEITLLCPTRWTVRVKSLSEITLLCPTRWTVRAKSLSSIINNYQQWSLENESLHSWCRCTYENFWLFLWHPHWGTYISTQWSKTLQTSTLAAIEGQYTAHSTIVILQKLRTDESFNLF